MAGRGMAIAGQRRAIAGQVFGPGEAPSRGPPSHPAFAPFSLLLPLPPFFENSQLRRTQRRASGQRTSLAVPSSAPQRVSACAGTRQDPGREALTEQSLTKRPADATTCAGGGALRGRGQDFGHEAYNSITRALHDASGQPLVWATQVAQYFPSQYVRARVDAPRLSPRCDKRR